MPTDTTNPSDPDGRAVMEVFTDLEVSAESAHNVTQGIRNMAGRDVIAKIEEMEASTIARIDAFEASIFARIDAFEANTIARIDAFEASMNLRFDGVEARLDASLTQIEVLGWAVMATLALVTALGAKGFLGKRKKRRSRKRNRNSGSDH